MALITIWYIAGKRPFIERRTMFTESLNEISVLFCIYLVMLFMMAYDVTFINDMTKVFIAVVA